MSLSQFLRKPYLVLGFSLLALLFFLAHATWGQIPGVTTKAFTNDRAGANLNELIITPAKLSALGLARRTTIPVYGDARGTESQPLILPAVKRADGTVHDIMILPSMANVVRGVDAQQGAALWQVTLGTPVQGGPSIDFHQINDKWGVLSTGVIDPDTGRVYLVAWVSPDGTPQKAIHYMFVLNVADGTLVCPPVTLAGLTSRAQTYSSAMRKQRSALVLAQVLGKKTVFFASGTVLETTSGASGWIFAFDVATNKFTAALAMSDGLGAGIWMGSQGLVADNYGFLYGATGNGSFNGATDFGECIFKVQYVPPTDTAAATLQVVSWWSPYSDAGRTGINPTFSDPDPAPVPKMAGMSAVSEAVRPVGSGMAPMSMVTAKVVTNIDAQGNPVQLVYPKLPNQLAWIDEDLGSGGCVMTPYKYLLCSGKDGIGYVVNATKMGNTQPADFLNAKANCAKLVTPPVWMTASPGPVDPCPQDETTLNFMPWGKTRHLHMTPVLYQSPTRGLTIFVWGENSQLHAWTMASTGAMTYLAQSNESASANITGSPGGMPGGFCSLSSNQNKAGTAVLWCSIPYGDANATITNGRLIAYDPENVVNGTLQVLWDSEKWAIPYVFNKFQAPIVWNGQVYLDNYNGGVDVYGIPGN